MKKIQKTLFMLIYTLFVMTAGWAATKTWVGGDSSKPTDWDTPGNWSPTGVPNAGDTVIINSGVNQPVIENKEFHLIPTTKEISITKLTINENAKLTIVSKKNDVKLVCTSGIINNGTIILDLNRNTKKIEFTKTDFQGESEIYIDAPFTTPIAYSVSFISNTQIDFKTNSVVTAEYGHDDDILVINTSKLNVIGSFTSERRLEIQNASGVELNITGTLTAKRSVTVPDNATTKITSPGSVNLEKTVDWNNVIWNASGGTITTKGDFQVKKFSQSNSGTLRLIGEKQKLHIKEVYNLEIADSNTAAKPAVLQGNLIISGSFTNNGNFEANGQTVTFNGDNSKIMGSKVTTFSDLRIESSKKLTLGQHIKIGGAFHNDGTFEPASYKVSFTGNPCEVRGASNTTFYDFEVESGAVCKIHRDITVKNSFTNAGTFNAAGTQRTVYLEPPAGGTVTITGTSNQNSTKFYSIKCENAGGKTLKIAEKISAEEMILSGTASPSSYLRIDSDTNGEIHLKTNYTGTGSDLDINTDKVKIEPVGIHSADWGYEVYHSVKNGIPVSSSGTVVNGWKFIGGSPPPPFTGTLYWIGKTDTEWETAGNWAEKSGSVYTESSHIPSYNAEVVIPQKNSINILGTTYPAQFPKLTNDFKAKSVEIKKDANSSGNNGMLDLSEYVIKAGFSKNAKIENYGTLKLAGTTAQKTWFGAANDEKIHLNDDTCIVEYYGNSPANPTIWGGPYQNLKVSGGKTRITTGNLVVNKSFTVDTTGVFTVNAASQSYAELVTLHQQTTFNSTDGTGTGTVFNGGLMTNNRYIFFGGAGRIQTHDIYGGSEDITLNAGTGTWTSSGDIQARDIILSDSTGAWTSTGTISARNITVGTGSDKWTSSGAITASGNITVKRAWTATDSALVQTGDISVEGDWESHYVSAINITVTGNWTSSYSVSATGNITVDNSGHTNTWTTAHNVTFSGNLTAAKFVQTDETLQYNGNTAKTILFRNSAHSQINNIIIGNTGIINLGSDIRIKKIFMNFGQVNHNDHKVTFTGTEASIGSASSGTVTEFYDLEIDSGAVLSLNQDIKIKRHFTNKGTYAANGKTVSFVKGASLPEAASTITGNALSFANLTIESGKALTINNNGIEISGILTNDGIFDAQAHNKTVTFRTTAGQITRTQPNPTPVPQNKFYDLKIADNAILKVVLTGIADNAHDKFIEMDIKNSFVNGQDGQLIPHFSNFVFSGNSTINSGNNNINFTDITINNGASLTLNRPITVGGTFKSDGNFNAEGNIVRFRSGNHGLEITGTTGTMTFSDVEIMTGANLVLKRDITVAGNFTNNGTFSAISSTSPPIAGHTVTLKHPSTINDIVVKGNDSAGAIGTTNNTDFYNLVCTGAGGKTITFANKISVYGNLTLRGSGVASLLTISGTDNITSASLIPNVNHSGTIYINNKKDPSTEPDRCKWLNINVNLPIRSIGGLTYTCTAYESSIYKSAESATILLIEKGNPLNWIFKDYIGTMNWKGSASSDETNWNNPKNWLPEGTPSKKTDVLIPLNTGNKYPKLTADVSAKSVTVNSDADLDIAGFVINDISGNCPLTVNTNGTLKLKGETIQKNWFASSNAADKITLEENSIVEYNDNPSSLSDIWEGPYQKLKISGARQNLNASSLTVNKDLIITRSPVEIITAGGTQTYHGNVIAFKEVSSSPPTYTYYDLTLANTGTGTIKTSRGVTTGNLTVNGKWEAGDQNNSATVEVNGNLNVSGDIASVNSSIRAKKVSGSGGNITVNGAKDWRCWGNITAEGDMTIHNMTATGGTIAVHGNMTAHTFHLAGWGKLYFNGSSPQNLNFTDTAGSQIRELEIGSSSTLNLGSPIKITEILTNNGIFAAGNYTVTLGKATPIGSGVTAPTRITITGTSAAANTQFKDLICTDSYIKKLTINKNISVNGSLKLQGKSAASPLTVAGGTSDSEITLNSHKTGGKWLSVHTNIPITGTTGGADPQPCTYTAEESLPDGTDNDILAGKPDNWIFTNYSGDISWTGKKSEVWADHRNWTPYSIPGKQSAVKIPVVKAQYPKLTAAGAEAASVTVNSGATLDLAGEIIQDSGTGGTARAHIHNLGTLRMTGTSGQKQWLEIDNTNPNDNIDHDNNSAIEYYGTSTAAIWKGPYKNLNLRRSVENIDSVSGSEQNIQVDGKTNIYGDLTIKGAKQTYTGAVTGTASGGTGRGNITFDTVTLLKTNNITAGSITVNGSWELGTSGTSAAVQANGTVTVTGDWNSYGSITAQGTGNITANGNWTSFGEIIANGDITVDNTGNNNKWKFSGTQIRVKGNLTAAEFIQTDGVLSFRKPDSPAAKTLLFRHPDTSEINNLTIEDGTDGNAALTLGSDVRIKGWFLNKGIFNHGDKTINFIGNSSSIGKGDSEPGNITEFYNLTIINGADLKPWKDFKVKNAFLNNGTFAHGNKKLTFTGNNASIGKGDSEPGNITEFYDIEIAAPPNPQTTPPRNPKLTLYQNINLKNSLTNNGTFDAVTKTKTVNLNTDAGGTVTITGNTDETKTNFHTLQFTGAGGKKLQINKKITVAESLNLKGTARGNLLTVNGASDSYITLGKNMLGGKWLNVKTNIPIKVGFTYTTEESKPDGSDDDINSGKPKNWIFNNCISLMTWTAAAAAPDKTKWDNRENWIPRGIPGQYTPVMIPKEKQAYPKLESGTNAKAASVTLNGELDLDSYLISDDDGGTSRSPVTNNGLLKMIGTAGSLADQKAWLELPASDTGNCIIHNSGSKIEYYGSTNNPVWAGPYKNLILGENRANLTAGDLKVSETLTVDSNTRNPITITANNQTYEGLVTLRNNTVFNSTDANGTVFNEKIEAAGFDITLDGTGPIQTKKEVNANNIKANMGAGSWTSSGAIATTENIDAQRNWKSSGTVSVIGNIAASADWTSSAYVTVNGNITADNSSHNNTWTVEGGNISLKGNFNANKFMPLETAGTLIFNGNTQTINLIDTASIVRKLQIESSSSVSLLSPLTLISSFENKGKFDASGQDVTLKPEDTITITGTNNEKDTQFYNLLCEDQGGKTFSVINKIWVEEKMYLSGSYVSPAIVPLNVTGQKGAIYLNAPHSVSEDEIDNVRQKYLKVWPDNVMINEGNINEKFYVAAESTDNENTTKNQKGWVFYKSFELVNSFARPNENKIYLLFKNGSSNDIDIVLEENDLAAPKSSPLKIKKGISDVDIYTKNDSRAPKKLNLSSIPERHTFWEFTIDDKVSPDWILDPNAIVYLDYYGKRKEKYRISDIGINMVTPQLAFNSVILRNFDAADDDNPLPRLDVRIPTEKAAASSNIILHFFSDTVKHKFWHPDFITFPQNISISAFAESKSQTSPYPYTFENKLITFIIPETDAYLKPETVGSFMYVYDGWLPCARLLDSNDMLSFDAWHFKIVGVRKQRGGVSIFNNVVNPHKGEEAIITPHLKKAGTLTIQIMTIDGSVVRTLERSYKAAGDHIYKWDGRNNGGNPVASGIYFVRIAGPDIDEMRKILVIK